MLYHRQIRGIIAIGLLLAIIPFSRFVCGNPYDLHGPALSLSRNNTKSVEFIDDAGNSGIYFIEPSITLKHFLKKIDLEADIIDDSNLNSGMSIRTWNTKTKSGVVVGQMSAEKRIALGLPINLNEASLEALILIPGIGEPTAQKIILRRREKGIFVSLEQLKEINGIKERKIEKLSRYLYVEPCQSGEKRKTSR